MKNKKNKKKTYLYGPNENILNKVAEVLGNEKRGKLLDVGSGSGVLAKKLYELGFKVEACDLDPTGFRFDEKIKITKADLGKNLPFKDNYFDYATCTEVLEYLENPWIPIREIHRILKKGKGCFFTSKLF